jgi:hypothetical protein
MKSKEFRARRVDRSRLASFSPQTSPHTSLNHNAHRRLAICPLFHCISAARFTPQVPLGWFLCCRSYTAHRYNLPSKHCGFRLEPGLLHYEPILLVLHAVGTRISQPSFVVQEMPRCLRMVIDLDYIWSLPERIPVSFWE